MYCWWLLGLQRGSSPIACPRSFLPDEDQGYAYIKLQLPNAASLERTTAVAEDVEKVIMNTPGVQYTTTVVGFSLLSFVRTSYNAFFSVALKPWDTRKAIITVSILIDQGSSQPGVKQVACGSGLQFFPAGDSWRRHCRRIHLYPRRPSRGGDIQFLARNLGLFLQAARKRPEIASLTTTFLPSVPQQFVDVDRDKVLKQGVNLNDVYRTVQAFMGGYFINYFNRFGRQWQVYVEAESEYRGRAENVGQFYVRNSKGENVPLSTLTHGQAALRPGIYDALR